MKNTCVLTAFDSIESERFSFNYKIYSSSMYLTVIKNSWGKNDGIAFYVLHELFRINFDLFTSASCMLQSHSCNLLVYVIGSMRREENTEQKQYIHNTLLKRQHQHTNTPTHYIKIFTNKHFVPGILCHLPQFH